MQEEKLTLQKIEEILENYEPSDATKQIVADTKIALLVGISGAGKDTIQHELLGTQLFQPIVSHTTRAPRNNHGVLETNGHHYHFITMQDALELLQNGTYIEANIYGGNVYGTTIKDILKAHNNGLIGLNDIEVNGVANFKKISNQVVAIFIVPPSFHEWQKRLLSRYSETGVEPEDLFKRMQTAVKELEHALSKPYFHFVVNDELNQAVITTAKIASGNDSFNEIDEHVRHQSEKLLADLKEHLQS